MNLICRPDGGSHHLYQVSVVDAAALRSNLGSRPRADMRGGLWPARFRPLRVPDAAPSDPTPVYFSMTRSNLLGLRGGGWDEVAAVLMPWKAKDGDSERDLIEARAFMASALARFSREFENEKLTAEYNSIKHGLRHASSDWYLAIGMEETPGVPAPAENMRVMASSEFGGSFLAAVSPLDAPHKHHVVFRDQRVNWNPKTLVGLIPMIAAALRNVVAFLRVRAGEGVDELAFEIGDMGTFDHLWELHQSESSTRFSIELVHRENIDTSITSHQVRMWYDEQAVRLRHRREGK